MITCDLIGRLGNHLFQQATVAATAWRNGSIFGFPTRSIGSYTGEVYFPHLPLAPVRPYPIYTERSHRYQPIPRNLKDVKLHGYFQCDKYFDEYRDWILEMFNMPPIPQQADCSIHIRLGDYVQFKDKHPPVTVDYIEQAIGLMIDKGCRKFLIFSDDNNIARDIVSKTAYWGAAWFDMCSEQDPKKSMQIMAGCPNNIIANSSFSWWGSYLGPQEGRTVIAPKTWFGPANANLDPTDIYRQNWIVI